MDEKAKPKNQRKKPVLRTSYRLKFLYTHHKNSTVKYPSKKRTMNILVSDAIKKF